MREVITTGGWTAKRRTIGSEKWRAAGIKVRRRTWVAGYLFGTTSFSHSF
jgi:hypothetical protein